MFILAMVWLFLFVVELVQGLSPFQEDLILVIWIPYQAHPGSWKTALYPKQLDHHYCTHHSRPEGFQDLLRHQNPAFR